MYDVRPPIAVDSNRFMDQFRIFIRRAEGQVFLFA